MTLPAQSNSIGGPGSRAGDGGRPGSSRNNANSSGIGGSLGTSGGPGSSRKRVRESGNLNGDGGTMRFAGILGAAAARATSNALQLEAMNISPSLSLSEDGMMAVGLINNGVPASAFASELHPDEIDPDDPNGDDDVEEDVDFHLYHSNIQSFEPDANSLVLAAQNQNDVSAIFVPYYPHLGANNFVPK